MKQSALVKLLQAAAHDATLTGERIGRQEMVDFVQIVLNKHGFGVARIIPFIEECLDIADYYEPAFCKGQEQDVFQERLDRELIRIANGKVPVLPFSTRYPEIRTMDFSKPLHNVTPIEYKGKED